MTQEERDLLVQLALPYEVMLHIEEVDNSYDDRLGIIGLNHGDRVYVNGLCIDNNGRDSYAIIKPYLRPLSSMTEEEKNEYYQIRKKDSEEALTIMDCGDHLQQLLFPITSWTKTIDWLNKKMFDYRGLISINLALEAPEDMYN